MYYFLPTLPGACGCVVTAGFFSQKKRKADFSKRLKTLHNWVVFSKANFGRFKGQASLFSQDVD